MSINGIGTAGYSLTGYTARKMERNAASGAAGFMETVQEKAAQANAADYDEKAFEMAGPNAPQEVKDVWMDAAKEVNANGMGIRGSGMMSHIPQMMVIENKGPSLFLFFNKGEGYIPFEWLLLQLQQMR